ncbi:PEP-CTERM sorting domain-containing protein [Thermosulfuriphilus sp.]
MVFRKCLFFSLLLSLLLAPFAQAGDVAFGGGGISSGEGGNLAVPADSVDFLPSISPGVSLSPAPVPWVANIAGPLGGVTYGPVAYAGYPGGASGWVQSTYTIPNSGYYSLFFLVSDIYDEIYDSALAIDNIWVAKSDGVTTTSYFSESFEAGIPEDWTVGGHAGVSTNVPGVPAVNGNYFAYIDTVGETAYDTYYFTGTLTGTIDLDTGDVTGSFASTDIPLSGEFYGNFDGPYGFGNAYGELYTTSLSGGWGIYPGQESPYEGYLELYEGSYGGELGVGVGQISVTAQIYAQINGSDLSGVIEGEASLPSPDSPVVDTSQWGGTTGTYLQSPTFYAEAGAIVHFYANFLTNDGDGYPDFALAQLLDASTGNPVATLYTADAASSFVYGLDPNYPLLPPGEIPPGGPFEFEEIPVNPDVIYYFDPAVAIGYDYEVNGNAFASVLLPDETSLYAGADNLYDLWLFDNVSGEFFDTEIDITGGVQFSFLDLDLDLDGNPDFPNGITLFRILGIDPRAGLDPSNPLAFVTGLSFVNAGTAKVTQTPIPTPEPASLILLGNGLLGAWFLKRRKVSN